MSALVASEQEQLTTAICQPWSVARPTLSVVSFHRFGEEANLVGGALANMRDGSGVRVAGIVTIGQRPGTTARVVFVTFGDATGRTNLIIWLKALESHRQAVMTSKLADVVDRLQTNHVEVRHMMASRVEGAGDMLGTL